MIIESRLGPPQTIEFNNLDQFIHFVNFQSHSPWRVNQSHVPTPIGSTMIHARNMHLNSEQYFEYPQDMPHFVWRHLSGWHITSDEINQFKTQARL